MLTNGNIVVTWADTAAPQQAHYRIYDPNLNPLTPILNVNSADATKATNHPDVAALADGGFVIADEFAFSATDHDIYAVRYTAAGVQNGAIIPVNTSTSFDEFPSVAGLADGGFAIAHDRSTAGNTAMFDSVWNANGTNRSPDTQFDATGTINDFADVVALPAGGFAVNYEDNQYGANSGYQQRLFLGCGRTQLDFTRHE